MDFNILDDVLSKLNWKLVRERRNLVLFLDNAPCHPPDMKGKNDHIKIVFIPPNCTYRLQPLDLGIIQTFKLKYMKLLLTHVVSKTDDCNSATDVSKSVDLLQAIRWIAQARENVSRQQDVDLEFAMSIRTSSSANSSKASIRVGRIVESLFPTLSSMT